MKELKSNRYGKIIPIKLIGNQLVKIKDIPGLESKKLKNYLDSSVSTSTEPSNRQNSNNVSNTSVEKLSADRSKKYSQLMEDIKNEKEMIGTVEENLGDYPNYDPFGPLSNIHPQSFMSKTKKVLFQKKHSKELILKVLDSKLFLSLYNKPPLQHKYFRISEIGQIIKIQNRFKGIYFEF